MITRLLKSIAIYLLVPYLQKRLYKIEHLRVHLEKQMIVTNDDLKLEVIEIRLTKLQGQVEELERLWSWLEKK